MLGEIKLLKGGVDIEQAILIFVLCIQNLNILHGMYINPFSGLKC